MISRRLIVSACAVAMFTTVNVANVIAQGGTADSKTEFTFNAPVELPGVTLPPGTYVFRFADPNTSRQVMQVLAKDDSKKTYGLFLTLQATRPTMSGNAEIRFLEAPVGKPVAVKTWWYPGNTIGREFIYPRSQAIRLAKASNTTVLTTKEENVSTDKMSTADLAYVSPTGQDTVATDQVAAAATTSAPAPDSLDRTPVQQNQTASNTSNRSELPKTNGLLPLTALMGAMSLAGGASLRFRH